MRRTITSLSSLILSIILLIVGNAYLMTLLGLRLSMEDFDPGIIGWILAFYSIGFVAGTLYAGRIIEKVGHIRAFAVFAAVLAASTLIYPMAIDTWLWGFLRAIGGFVMAGLMIVMESWFSSKADNRNRASLFAIYQVIFFLSTAGGQVLIRVADPASFIPFSLATILVVLALTPLSMTRRTSPTITREDRLSLTRLYRKSPSGTLGALVAGLLISAFYAMGPVYADRVGLDLNQLSNFMAAAIVSAMILAWPIGRLCDQFDRYRVMLVAAAVAGACSLAAALVGNASMIALVFFVGLYMGISAAIYPIAVAITNDLMESHQITAASTALLLSYGLGSIIGPLLSALFMDVLGPQGLFVSNTLVLAALILFMLVGPQHRHPTVEQQEHYYPTMPEAALGVAELDPRNTEFEESTETMEEEGLKTGPVASRSDQ
ncbi:Predicted arabinose efflux permease, MFS family [Marinobacter segnicrescens]|uniref:Predicted arabinose efflux permease, MFS family n=1 Tax=Marinobacter segnicrescens TaxID=430453 RepID=A0A1I0CVF9_9GAMM|nr:MFS transporter [Marinobacter segnicrescens]SET23727.1 Predicted arabinose efflux permease, MFS family [Marinobacter segnicrescens]